MEKNYFNINKIQLRGDSDSRIISGRAVVFGSDSQNMGFVERIAQGAITQETLDGSDIFALYNHDDNQVLARSNQGHGTLALDLDDDGLNFMFEAPNTTLGNDILELVRRGDLTSCSFAFTIPEQDSGAQRWYREGDTLRRDILKIDRLYDVSIVNNPAYPATSVSARNMVEQVNATDAELDSMMSEIDKLM